MVDPSKLKYAETHEWVNLEGKVATIGITDHAQKEISDVVFVELPKAGRSLKQKDSAMVIESVKAAFDIYSPVSGKVTKVNDKLQMNPELVNKSPYGDGWLFQVECDNPAELNGLMTEEQYNNQKQASH